MLTFISVVVFGLGFSVVVATLISAIRTFVLPRGENVLLTRLVFMVVWIFFDLRTRNKPLLERERRIALFAPVGLLLLPVIWLICVMLGYTGMFWALGGRSLRAAFTVSGSSLLTLGFAPINDLPSTVLAFSEATIGLGLMALLLAYLPTMYSAFSRREAAVALLEVRAGSPPSALEMILRFHRIHGLQGLDEQWAMWETWFADVEESHTSLAPLIFFRSPRPDRSWITASGAVLDTAALMASTVDYPRSSQADLTIRAGYLALQQIAEFFSMDFDPHPLPTDPISITRAEYDELCAKLAAAGVPIKLDRDQAWRDFAGWRVNYDRVLLLLAGMTLAPPAPWSSDRAIERGPMLFAKKERLKASQREET